MSLGVPVWVLEAVVRSLASEEEVLEAQELVPVTPMVPGSSPVVQGLSPVVLEAVGPALLPRPAPGFV